AGSTLEQTRAVMDRLSAAAVKDDSVLSIQATAGFSVTGSGQNVGQAFIRLKDWDDRKDDADTIAARLTAAMASVPDAQVFITSPPAILGLGDAGGFTLELQDEGGAGHAAAVAARNTLLRDAAKDPKLVNVRYASLEDAPVYAVKVDDAKAQAMGVNPQDINDTLNAALGGDFVNNFIYKGRIKKVFIQGTAEARMQPQDIERWSVRNQAGQMVPLSSLVSAHWTSAPAALQRYNGVSAMEITGQPAPGVSSGEAMAEIARLADTLPEGFSHAWSDMAYQEQLSGNQAPMLYAISLLFVFLCLAALYESWAIPFSVILVVPLGVLGTLAGAVLKNGILIVEFARILEQQGKRTREAILQAVYLRLRPIVMTSLAFLMGVLPLVFATGAGSAARRSLGTGVAGGTVASMVLGMFFVPLFYLLVRRMFPGRAPAEATAPEASP
ncbi:MAG: efflux RND transporter permease subunit, partial [Stenotrophomonas sp.]|nr:efflux RND transporter permease subunit [Stenotrophomonas sp.]